MIGLIGATGNTGGQVAKALKARGADFRVIARDLDKAKEKLGADTDVVQGDLADPASLDKALAGLDTVYVVVGHSPQLYELESNAIEAAKRAGVKRFILQTGSSRGIRPDSPSEILVMHYKAQELLKASGMQWTIVQPNYYMSNFLAMTAPINQMNKLILPFPEDTVVSMIHPADIGEAAAEIAMNEGHDGETYYLAGPPITFKNVVDELSRVSGRDIAFVEAPEENMRGALKQRGAPDWLIAHMMGMMSVLRAGDMAPESEWVKKLTGHEPRTIKQWMDENKAAFAA